MFKSIDGHLTTIFSKTQKVNSGFEMTSQEIGDIVGRFNELKQTQNTVGLDALYKDVATKNKAVAGMLENLGKQGASAKANLEGVYAVMLQGETTGFKNVMGVIDKFNTIDPSHQKDFANAVGVTNANLGQYLSNVQVGSASTKGYGRQLVATTAKTIGLQVATTALNAAISLGITALVSFAVMGVAKVVSWIDDLVISEKEGKEATENLISSFKSLKEETDALAKNSNTLVSEYAKLSKGVDNLGKNVSLTSDEYERYKELCNQIAEDIPSLIIGYDNEGNAILRLRDNVDDLKQSYIEARKEKYNLMLSEDENVDDTVTHYKHLKNPNILNKMFDFGNTTVGKSISAKEAAETLKTAINSTYEELMDMLPNAGANDSSEILPSNSVGYLEALGFDIRTTEEEFLELQKVFRTELKTLEADIESGLTGIKDIANMYLFTNDDYYNLSDEMQNIASVMINSIPDDLAETWENKYDINEYVESIVNKLKNASPDIQSAYRHLFNLSLDDLSISEAKDKVDGLLKELADYLGIDANQLKVQLGFEVVDENEDELDRIITRAVNKYTADKKSEERYHFKESFNDSINERGINTKEELAILAECIDSTNSASKALELYDEKVKQAESDNAEAVRSLDELKEAYDNVSDSTSKFTSNQKTLTDALDEQKEHGQLSASTIQSLVEAGYAQALVTDKVTGAVTLNIKEYERLNEQKRQAIILEAEQQKTELEQKFKDEKRAIYDLVAEYEHANEERRKAIILEKEQHGLAMADIAAQLAQVDALARSTTAPTFESGGSSSSDDKPQSIIDFETELTRRQHEIKMGRMEEDEAYFDWLEKAYREAYKGLTGYQDDIYKYEEMVYDGRQKLAEDFYNEQKKKHENRVEELKSQITVTENKSIDSNGNSLNPFEKFDYIRASYSDLIAENERRINEIVQSGIEGHEDEVKELERQIEEYADKLQDVFKDEIDYEIDYIETIQDKYNDFIDKRIDRYEDEKKTLEDRYDAEIKSIDDTIDALKDKNDATSKAIELKKSEQGLENAKQRTRKVYGADGSVTYRQDTDKVEEAQQKVDDLKLDMLIDSLEQQKEAKESEKDAALEKYDTMITDLEAQKSSQDEFFKSVLEKLDNINNPKPTESIDRIIDKAYANDPKEAEKVKQKLKDSYVENSDKDKKNSNKSDDDTVKKASLSKTVAKSSNENKDNVQIEQTSNYDSFMKLVYSMSGKEPDGYERWKRGEYDEGNKLMSNIFSDDAFMNRAQKPFEDAINSFNETLAKAGVTTVEKQQPVNVTIGDIHIDKPVGDVEQFARELKMRIHPTFDRQIHTNLKY